MECKSVIATPSGHYPPNAHCSLPEGSGTATEWNLNIIVTHTQRTTKRHTPTGPWNHGAVEPWSRHEHRFTWTNLDLESRSKEIEAGLYQNGDQNQNRTRT